MRAHFAIFSVAAVLVFVNNASSARILGLFPHTGKSHQMVFEPLLRRLAERGHHVTVVSFFPLKNRPENYTDVSLEGIASLGVETIDMAEFESYNGIVEVPLWIENIMRQIFDINPLGDMALNVCSKLVSWQPLAEALRKDYDVALVEFFNSDCVHGLMHVYGKKVPTIAMLSSGLMQWSADRIGVTDNPAYVPTFSSFLTSRMTFMERLENTIANCYLKLWYRYKVQMKEQEIIERHFGRKIPDLNDIAKNSTTMMMANVFHSLNGAKPLLPGLVEVGGMHLNPKSTGIPLYMERFLNESDQGVVLFSFGSLLKTSTIPEYKEQMIMNALSRLKQNVIWKYENSAEEGTRIGNILKVRWIPQYDLLRHKKVIAFIGHGGLLGMTEVVSVGKPMLVVPFFGDQPYNGKMAEEVGLGLSIPYRHITEKRFYEAISTVLSAEMRLSARRVSKIWHDRETKPLDKAIYWVERVIRWGHQDPLHSSSRDLNIIQLSLLDIAAASIVAIIVLIILTKLLLSLLFRLIKVSFNSKVKDKLH
ncbi:unnamed protein product [Diatraea saccharalis]|uniref:Glucuronosyltransferase n=1 Tax=Diatraea saccharalis TaxID=40085 RepID=A0A9N9QYB7_9NEOP|nr:unnamed protein product [Diatraea saccharalis]